MSSISMARQLERIPIRLNMECALESLSGRIFCGKPVSTFPENALKLGIGDCKLVMVAVSESEFRRPAERMRIPSRF
jgi:hypothetical protein